MENDNTSDYLQRKREEAKAYLGTNYVLHPDYKFIKHHSHQHTQSRVLMNYLVESNAITDGRV
jgi:hypothetical protein